MTRLVEVLRERNRIFDGNATRELARYVEVRSRLFGGAGDAWRNALKNGVSSKKTVTKAVFVLLEFISGILWFLLISAALLLSAGAGDVSIDEGRDEKGDDAPD